MRLSKRLAADVPGTKRSPVILFLDIVIGVLCVLLVGALFFAIASFRENASYSYDEDSFYWRLEDGSFGQMVEMYYSNEAAGVEPTEDLLEYYAVAKYFEAASYYVLYQEDAPEYAGYYQEKMETAAAEMGELAFLTEKIQKQLGVQ